ncbi:uncharacterized protein A4U43_C04F4410 [Asparagus officinalis]|uniref:SMC hinge domain-containing protein n=1 Tax=Asparagus officinalis TaxID=4686 RepID=A0A5P1F3N4_ASPOF|nr:uncharacterized protein A4U43_C04F4410 [Asparagus officinalis]
MDDTIQYTFKNGRCTVPFVRVPKEQGPFSFSASHTQYPDLCENIEVHVVQASNLDVIPMADSNPIICQSQCPYDRLLPLQDSSQCSPSQLNLLKGTIMDDVKSFDEEIEEAGLQVKKHEDKLKLLNKQKEEIGEQICHLQGRIEPLDLTHVDSLANFKGQIIKHIEGKRNTAAAVFCNLSKAIQTAEPQKHFMQDFIGLVALLGTVSDSKYSSIFAEYLGEDYMLAVVCKSYKTASALESYCENGKVSRNSALHEAAATLGITINRRFPVICLEEIKPYKGGLKKNDPQRKLALPNPLLPSQGIPAGFLGYAVNMIELDVHHLNTRTARGYGLRETLFYRLLGEAQVYETREHMRMAAGCIKHGALSLDGGIMKDNGVIFLGDHEPAVRFPVAVPNEQGRLSRQNIHDMEQIEEKKAYLAHICEEINKEGEAHSKAVAKFYKKKDKYHKYLDKKRILNMDNLLGQSTRLSTS